MSLTDNTTKDNYIKLIVSTGPTSIDEVDPMPFREIDITHQILDEIGGFDEFTLRGYKWQLNNTGGNKPIGDLKRLKDTIDWEAERIFDACMVNDKQKRAVKELFRTRTWDAFERDWRDLELALALLKKAKK